MNSGKSETGKPETEKSETGKPETEKPETGQPETGNPNIKKIAVTNRHLCHEYFVKKGLVSKETDPCECLLRLLEKLAKSSDYDTVLLREKDMTEADYAKLAASVSAICEEYGKTLILHNFPLVAEKLGRPIHLPFSMFLSLQNDQAGGVNAIGTANHQAGNGVTAGTSIHIGTSVHSLEDAVYAESHGASYVIAGHIFETDCKKGLQGRGLTWLSSICKAVSVPVYAIGGITDENAGTVLKCGVDGYCMMSQILMYAKTDIDS